MRNSSAVSIKLLTVLMTAAVFGWATGAQADATWQATIKVFESAGVSNSLVFGVDPAGTAGVDGALGEVVQPPLPPAGNFDTRFTDNQLIKELRSGLTANIASTTLALGFQRKVSGTPIVLSWSQAAVAARTTSAVVQDQFGGVLGVNTDMRATGSVTITSGSISAVNVIFTSVDPFVAHTLLAVTQTPTTILSFINGTGGNAMTPALVVRARDGAGAEANGVAITLSLAAGAGSLSGTLTASTAGGAGATFSNVTYLAAAAAAGTENFTIRASANDALGNPITVNTAQLTATVQALVAPTLTPVAAPVAGTNENRRPLLAWAAVPIAASYVIDFGLAPACESVANEVSVTGLSYQTSGLADGNYCWRVKSVDASSNVSAYSADSTFTTIPAFGQWGTILLVVAMAGAGALFVRRRAGAAA